jgi:hypothetical protein
MMYLGPGLLSRFGGYVITGTLKIASFFAVNIRRELLAQFVEKKMITVIIIVMPVSEQL